MILFIISENLNDVAIYKSHVDDFHDRYVSLIMTSNITIIFV